MKDEVKHDKFSELRKRAEKIFEEQGEDSRRIESNNLQHLIHELQVHQIELETQNEELRQSQLELNAAQRKYFDLFELAPVGYFKIDKKGLILEVNLTGADLLRREKIYLIKSEFFHYVAKDYQDVFYLHCRQLFETKTPQTCELKMVKHDGTQFYVQLVSRVAPNSEDNIGQFLATITDISERKQAEEQIEADRDEKTALLREIHHRVRNNLAVIVSLIDFAKMRAHDPEAKELLTELYNRIYTMDLIYNKLYQSQKLGKVKMKNYISELAYYLYSVYSLRGRTITPVFELQDVYFSIDQAVPCGIVMNELISNALKHAFEGREKGTVTIAMRKSDDDMLVIEVRDDGVGIPEEIDIEKPDTLGLKLAKNIVCGQLGGTLQVRRNNGTEVIVEFKSAGQSA